MIVSETRIKIKSLARPALEALMIAGVLILAFILGRISAFSQAKPSNPVQVIYPPLVPNPDQHYPAKTTGGTREATTDQEITSGPFAASKTGKVYYPTDCPSLNRVKPENRVYFASEAEAQGAGLSASAACQ